MGVWVRMDRAVDLWMGAWAVGDGVSGKWSQFHGCVGADRWGYGWMGEWEVGDGVSGKWSQFQGCVGADR